MPFLGNSGNVTPSGAQAYNFPQMGMQQQQISGQMGLQRMQQQSAADLQRNALASQSALQQSALGQQAAQANQQNATQNRALGLQNQQAQAANRTQQTSDAQRAFAASQNAATNQSAINNQQSRFSTVLPYFTDALTDIRGRINAGYNGTGPQGNQPNISDAPVFNENQIQQQVNAQQAQNDMRSQSEIRDMQSQMAGKGYGSQSPLLAALKQGYQNQNLATNTANNRDTRLNSAQANSSQVLKAQQAREGQYASRQNEDIERNRTLLGTLSPLLSALSGLV